MEPPAFNWTKVELKQEKRKDANAEVKTFNWTKVELKLYDDWQMPVYLNDF